MAPGDKDDNSISMNSAEFKAWLAMMEAMDAEEIKEYARVNKDVLTSEQKAAIKKVLQKKQPKRKKRTAVHPILGAVLKFHKDDDESPPPSPGGGGSTSGGAGGAIAC